MTINEYIRTKYYHRKKNDFIFRQTKDLRSKLSQDFFSMYFAHNIEFYIHFFRIREHPGSATLLEKSSSLFYLFLFAVQAVAPAGHDDADSDYRGWRAGGGEQPAAHPRPHSPLRGRPIQSGHQAGDRWHRRQWRRQERSRHQGGGGGEVIFLNINVVDPDPLGSALILAGGIRIHEGKNDPK